MTFTVIVILTGLQAAILVAWVAITLRKAKASQSNTPPTASGNETQPEEDSVKIISPDELLKLLDQKVPVLVLDVRTDGEFTSGHIAGAMNIDHMDVPEQLARLEPFKSQTIVVHCEHGMRAYPVEMLLMNKGYADVRHLDGDMSGWRAQGLPVER